MQRVSNAALSVALTVFVMAASLALIAAFWLMVTYVLDGLARLSWPRWFVISLLLIGTGQVSAQTAPSDAYVLVDAYPRQANSQKVISNTIATVFDTLRPSVQTDSRHQKRRISPKPAWAVPESSASENLSGPDPSAVFYIMAVEPNPSAYKSGYWFRSRPAGYATDKVPNDL